MKKTNFILLLCLCIYPSLAPAWLGAAFAWNTVKDGAIFLAQQVGVEIVAEYIQHSLQPTELAGVQRSIEELKVQLHQAQEHNVPQEEIQQVRKLLADTEQMLQKMRQQAHSSQTDLATTRQQITQDIGLLQNELAQMRNQLHQLGAKLERPFVSAQAVGQALDIRVNYTYRSQKLGKPKPLIEGSIVHSGDSYKVTFHSSQPAWVYIFQTDSSGKIFQLFPLKEMGGVVVNQANPVAAGETRTVPAPQKSFYLDDQAGTETLYFIATPKRDQELEARYQAYERVRDAKIPQGDQLLAQNALERGMFASRGPAGISQDPAVPEQQAITTDEGEMFMLNAGYLSGLCGKPGGCVNILRFEHR